MYCVRSKELRVCESQEGFYRGTVDAEGYPFCRCSALFYVNKKDAEKALRDQEFKLRDCIQNDICAKTMGFAKDCLN
jgi:hypothetical protein